MSTVVSVPKGVALSLVVPTFNERENVEPLIESIKGHLDGISWEVIFVDDDSPDGTAQLVKELGQQDGRIRCLHRIGRRGLSSACIEGALSSNAPYFLVMDGDLQHDPALLPKMYNEIESSQSDIVVGSRYIEGGSCDEWSQSRLNLSLFATTISQKVLKVKLSDPMSGFFVMRRRVFDQMAPHLSGIGFKILVDIFSSSPKPLNFKEIPYIFQNRYRGESKLDSNVMWEYLMLIADKTLKGVIPVRFLSFAFIGGMGIGVHLGVLTLCLKVFLLPFTSAQTSATLVAIAFNYTLNNLLTYSDNRRRGKKWVTGLLSFYLICALGAVANIAVSTFLYERDVHWILAALCGILISSIWNFTLSALYTWD